MSIGTKLYELRKKNNLSQEDVAEKLNVTRQTISKWELDETSPDLNYSKQLSILFNVSLDDLVENDIKNIVVEKVNNTEKLAGIIIKTLRVFGIMFIVLLFLSVISGLIFIMYSYLNINSLQTGNSSKTQNSTRYSATLVCELQDESYLIHFGSDGYFDCPDCTDKMNIFFLDHADWSTIDSGVNTISTYFKTDGGQCRVLSSEAVTSIE